MLPGGTVQLHEYSLYNRISSSPAQPIEDHRSVDGDGWWCSTVNTHTHLVKFLQSKAIIKPNGNAIKDAIYSSLHRRRRSPREISLSFVVTPPSTYNVQSPHHPRRIPITYYNINLGNVVIINMCQNEEIIIIIIIIIMDKSRCEAASQIGRDKCNISDNDCIQHCPYPVPPEMQIRCQF